MTMNKDVRAAAYRDALIVSVGWKLAMQHENMPWSILRARAQALVDRSAALIDADASPRAVAPLADRILGNIVVGTERSPEEVMRAATGPLT